MVIIEADKVYNQTVWGTIMATYNKYTQKINK